MDDWRTSLVLSDLQAACNALGGWDENVYVKEKDCVESLKDLLRYLRRDDESYAIRRALGKINVLKTDLLPLVRFHHRDQELFDIVTRLIVNLTTPVVLLYKEEIPIEKNARHIYMTLEAQLCTYKDAFLEKEIWSVLAERLEELMNLNLHERSEDDTETMTRILTILRNVLHPFHREEFQLKTNGDVSSHDRLLWALHLSGMDDLIIFMCASRMDQSHTLFVLEILRLMLREQEASCVASTGAQRPQEELQKDAEELMKLREIERKKKRVALKGVLHNRFSRFSSTYQVRNIKALGEDTKEIIVVGDPAKVLQSINNMDFDQKKKFRARAKNRRPEECSSIKRRTTLNIRLFLKEFCSDLLNSAFNALVPQVRRAVTRAGDSGDEGHYFWLLQFFLEFNRLTGFDIALISEAISKETFHFVQTQMEKCHEMMVTDKRRIHLWVKRLHMDLKTFYQLLLTVSTMSHHTDIQVREASKILQQYLFHLPEYRDIVLHLLLNFNDSVAPIDYLRDLAATVHVYLRMLQNYCDKGKLKVKDLRRNKQAKPPQFLELNEEELNDKWLRISKEVTALLEVEDSAFDYDVNSVLEGFQQYEEVFQVQICKSKIVDLLRKEETTSAIGLLRACRSLFQEDESFGEKSISVESEFLLLKQFFYADNIENVDELPKEDDDEMERMQDFDFEEFLKRFVNPKVVKVYGLLLSHYSSNSAEVNKMCVKMLHRIAFDLKMSAMLFQAQLFVVFDQILEDYSITPEIKELKELSRFAKYIVQEFVSVAKTNDLALVELLFWKNSAEAYQIQYGYNESEKSKVRPWTDEEETELKQLFEENNPQIQPGEDIIEIIQKKFSNETRTRRQIITHLRVMGLVEKGTRFKPSASSSSQPWSREEEEELQELYQNYATSIDPLGQIMLNMTAKRPKFRVIEKLLELGIIHDRSEVRKRRVRKNGEVVLPRSMKSGSREDRNTSMTSETSGSDGEGHELETEQTAEMFTENPEFVEQSSSSGNVRRTNRNKKKQKSSTRSSRIRKIVDPEKLAELLKKAVEQRGPAVNWITESIQDALEEWKDSGNEAVPLVPLLEAEHESIHDEEFCELLSAFGFVPPQEGVEQYWRIGGELTRGMLQARLDSLKAAQEGRFGNVGLDDLEEEGEREEEEEEREEEEEEREKEEEEQEREEMHSTLSSERPLSDAENSSDDDNTEHSENPTTEKTPNETNKKRRKSSNVETTKQKTKGLRLSEFIQNDEESTEYRSSIGSKRDHSTESNSAQNGAKKRRVIIESDDSSEESENGDQLDETSVTEGVNDESANPTPVKRNKKLVIESDNDDDE